VKPEERPKVEPVDHSTDDPDEVASRPIGTRSFVYGAKSLAASFVALLLMVLVDDSFAAAFWVLLAAGLLGIMFSVIERSTTDGAEVVSHRRVNVDVLATVVLGVLVMVIVAVLER
jgi:NADH:ubiquinone oxidoreductase subunit 6 (subunit J)